MTTTSTTSTVHQPLPRATFGLRRNDSLAVRPAEPVPPQAFDAGLWHRLLAMELDEPGVATPISKRLAAEHRWSDEQTARAIVEYKRFLYLTQRAGFEATPSRPVDLVWHEHLMHTEHYWGTLCRQVLANDLHHKPGTGGTDDGDRLMTQYRRTLDAYRQAFDSEAPAEIWPRPTTQRAANASIGPLLALCLAIGLVISCALKIWPLALVLLFGVVAALVAASRNAQGSTKRTDRGGSGCGGGGIGATGCADTGGGHRGDSGASSGGDSSGDGGGSSCGGGGCGGGGD